MDLGSRTFKNTSKLGSGIFTRTSALRAPQRGNARLQQKSVRYGKMSDAKVRKYGKMSHFTSGKYYLPEKGSVCVRRSPTKFNIFLGTRQDLRDRDFGFESRVGD